jgi:hypothetical protein
VIDYTDPQLLWWEESDPRRAGAQMVAVADRLYMAGVSRRERNLRHAKLFANQDLSSIYDCGVANYNGAGVYLSVNVTESCVNTLAAKLTRTRIRPVLLTDKASRTLQKQAEAGTDAMDGVFQANELHEAEGQQMFVDGALFGNGWAYGEYDQDDEREIVIDRVLPDEMLFDETEAMYGMRNLYTLYRRKYIHRQALYRMRDEKGKLFGDDPEKRDAIKRAPAVQNVGSVWADQGGQMVPVTFGWRLPSRKGAGDGRVLMAIGGASTADGMLITGSGIGDGTTLLGQEWKRAKFPLCQFTYQRRPIGLYGRSLAEQLVPIQLKINEQLEVIDEGQRLLAVARVFYNNGAINTDTVRQRGGPVHRDGRSVTPSRRSRSTPGTAPPPRCTRTSRPGSAGPTKSPASACCRRRPRSPRASPAPWLSGSCWTARTCGSATWASGGSASTATSARWCWTSPRRRWRADAS